MKGPLVSVVVPVYNMEVYLERCIRSLLSQTYRNLEIILVDDGSTDASSEIMKRFAREDRRIKTVQHSSNKGLFQARITGSTAATGTYLAFVDSDDYVSADWFRTLVRQAQKTCADITVGEWCFDFGENKQLFCALDHFRIQDYLLEGTAVQNAFMAAQGRNFSWTLVWNKLYSKALWEQCIPRFQAFSESHGHMVMWEDIAFSSALWFAASTVSNVHGALYFYVQHERASTSGWDNESKREKYLRDSGAAIGFFEETLRQYKCFEQYQQDFSAWRKQSMCIVYRDLVTSACDPAITRRIPEAFGCTAEDCCSPDNYYYSDMRPVEAYFFAAERALQFIVSQKAELLLPIYDAVIRLFPKDGMVIACLKKIVRAFLK